MINVYDKVWILDHNKPVEKLVFAIIHSMSHDKKTIDTKYRLVNELLGTGWGNDEGNGYHHNNIYLTKQDLIDAFTHQFKD